MALNKAVGIPTFYKLQLWNVVLKGVTKIATLCLVVADVLVLNLW